MALSLKADHLTRYRDIVRLLVKYGRSDLVKHAGLADAVSESEALPPAGEESLPASSPPSSGSRSRRRFWSSRRRPWRRPRWARSTAPCIVGAAMLMRVETSFRILGYPGLAMLCFIAAAGGGLTLVWSIVRSDIHRGEPPKKRA